MQLTFRLLVTGCICICLFIGIQGDSLAGENCSGQISFPASPSPKADFRIGPTAENIWATRIVTNLDLGYRLRLSGGSWSAPLPSDGSLVSVAVGKTARLEANNTITILHNPYIPGASTEDWELEFTGSAGDDLVMQIQNSAHPLNFIPIPGSGDFTGCPFPVVTIDQPPGQTSIQVGQSVNFQGTATDDGTVDYHQWDFSGGAPNSNQPDPGSVTFSTPDIYNVIYTATDNLGLSSSDSVEVTVAVNDPPTATITEPTTDPQYSIQTGEEVNFAGTATDDVAVASSFWNFGDNSIPDQNGNDPTPVTFSTPGTYDVVFTAADNLDLTGSDSVEVTVAVNDPPTSTITQPPGPTTIQIGQAVSFQGTATDNDGSIASRHWNFAGAAANQVDTDNPGSVTFAEPGTYNVVFTVTDNDGAVASDSVTITVNRKPADLVMVLDASGSMLNGDKYDHMTRAAQLFFDLYRTKAITGIDDHWGAVFFQWDCTADTNATVADPAALELLSAAPADIRPTIGSHRPPQISGYCTPIGEGLQLADATLGPPDPDRNRAILLLSDGKENRGTDIATVALGADVTVFSVGLGENAEIEPAKIEAVANNSGGEYRETSDPRNLDDLFTHILCDALAVAEAAAVDDNDGTSAVDIAKVDIATGSDRVIFIMTWSDPTEPVDFDLRTADGTLTITPASAGSPPAGFTVQYSTPASGDTHAFYTISDNDPNDSLTLAGSWVIDNIRIVGTAPGQPPQQPPQKIVLEDLQLKARFSAGLQPQYVNEPIMLTAEIRENGRPVTAADVFATVRGPVEGIGNFITAGLRKHGIAKLISRKPPTAAMPPGPSLDFQKLNRPGYVRTVKDLQAIQAYLKKRAAGVDTTPRGWITRRLLEVEEQTGLKAFTDRIRLYDDGTHGDQVAGDGRYTNTFARTAAEGTYRFTFTARGTGHDGNRFGRTNTIAKVVRIKVDPGNILPAKPLKKTTALPDLSKDMSQVKVTIAPRDKFGNFIGAFRSRAISFQAVDCKLKSSVIDNFDGSYSVIAAYRKTAENPVVRPVVYGQIYEPVKVKLKISWWEKLLQALFPRGCAPARQ